MSFEGVTATQFQMLESVVWSYIFHFSRTTRYQKIGEKNQRNFKSWAVQIFMTMDHVVTVGNQLVTFAKG